MFACTHCTAAGTVLGWWDCYWDCCWDCTGLLAVAGTVLSCCWDCTGLLGLLLGCCWDCTGLLAVAGTVLSCCWDCPLMGNCAQVLLQSVELQLYCLSQDTFPEGRHGRSRRCTCSGNTLPGHTLQHTHPPETQPAKKEAKTNVPLSHTLTNTL